MVVVLLVPLFLVNFYTKFVQHKSKKEGMDNRDSSNNDLTDQQKIDLMKKNNSGSNNSSLPITPVQQDTNNDNDSSNNNDESFSNNESKPNKKKYNIDYASTVEEAYDNLNKVIGGEGIKNLTNDTQRLMKQQLQLTEAMKNIGPLMESMGPLLGQANTLLKSFGGADNLKGLNDLANQLAPQ
jgi:phosphotransferase system IIB component